MRQQPDSKGWPEVREEVWKSLLTTLAVGVATWVIDELKERAKARAERKQATSSNPEEEIIRG